MPSKNYPKDVFEQIDIELCATEHNVDVLERLKSGYFPTYDETNLPQDLVNGQAFMTQQGHFCVYVSSGSTIASPYVGPPLFTKEGPDFYAAAFAHNSPFATGDPYKTTLTSEQETAFRAWVTDNHVPFDLTEDPTDYDMRGFYKASVIDNTIPNWGGSLSHFPDTYKTPYDTTFSKDSMYATPSCPFDWRPDQAWGDLLIDTRDSHIVFGPASWVPGATSPDGKIYCMPGEDTPPPPLPVWYRQWLAASTTPGSRIIDAPFISGNTSSSRNSALLELIPRPGASSNVILRKWKRDYSETYSCNDNFYTNDMTDPLMPFTVLTDDPPGMSSVTQLADDTYVGDTTHFVSGVVTPAPCSDVNSGSIITMEVHLIDDVVAGSHTVIDSMLVNGDEFGSPTNGPGLIPGNDYSYGFFTSDTWTYDGRFLYLKARYRTEGGAYGPPPVLSILGDAYLSDGSAISVAGGRVYLSGSGTFFVPPDGVSTYYADLLYWSRFSPTTNELIHRSWDTLVNEAGTNYDIVGYALNSSTRGVLATSGGDGSGDAISPFFDVSPDGTMIAYTTISDNHTGQLWLMNIDGSDKRHLFTFGLLYDSIFGNAPWGVVWNREGDTVGVMSGFYVADVINIETGKFDSITVSGPVVPGSGPAFSSWHWRP